jgi:hypothetical protein
MIRKIKLSLSMEAVNLQLVGGGEDSPAGVLALRPVSNNTATTE